MQPKFFLSLVAVSALSVLNSQSAAAQSPGCETTDEPGIVCPGDLSVSQIQEFLKKYSTPTGLKELKIFRIDSNANIQYLPAGLLADLRFSEIRITSCPKLSRVEDITGASSATLKEILFYGNALTEMPALTAPHVTKVTIIQPTTMTVSRSALSGMRSLQEIHIESASVMPLAFYDLKNLQTVRITSMPQETVRAQSFSFDSPTLKEVLLINDAHGWKGQAQPGAYQGFPTGSRLRIIESETITKEVYIGVLTDGGILDIPEPFHCDCRLAWLRLSPYVKQARVRCHTSTHPNDLENTPESNYSNCN
ncbi:LOW QUALITY PROTEIN: uncharacterized protein LOC119586227 [Penaeus monodon]|uniref:LOW QUALITY PROTEIN: uncharacterized protein LOC119586227 n=1 Tax=Penaeus monodon TaxID=6687 RepID=UPI0018A6EBFC|nr:LOW QUALITY PROTEIN: uncharacterized protein LOC119586227 [Penaeus monodon]